MAVRYPIALITSMALFPVLAHGDELVCAGDSGPLLTVGSKGLNRLGFAPNGREQILRLERWSICFRCAGFPRLDLTLRDAGAVETRVFAHARLCDGVGEATPPERYCIANASLRVDNKDNETCRFPKGTTLGRLWTTLTQSPPPESIDLWWSYPER
jgi:hypothetical protein